MPLDSKREMQVDLVEVSPGLAIIIVGPSQLLQRIEWLRLVEVAPMRFLLSIPPGTSIDSLELAVIELLEDTKPYDDREGSLLSQLRDLIRTLRRRGELSKAEMLFVDTRAMGDRTEAEPGPEDIEGIKGNEPKTGKEIALAATARMSKAGEWR